MEVKELSLMMEELLGRKVSVQTIDGEDTAEFETKSARYEIRANYPTKKFPGSIQVSRTPGALGGDMSVLGGGAFTNETLLNILAFIVRSEVLPVQEVVDSGGKTA